MCLLGNASEAEMAVEECLVTAWRSARELPSEGGLRPKLYRLLFQAVSRQRQEMRRRQPPAALPVVTGENPIAALRLLPEQLAQVVLLADVHEFTYEEILETLGISSETLMLRLSRGRDEFAVALTGGSPGSLQRLAWHDGLNQPRRLHAAQ